MFTFFGVGAWAGHSVETLGQWVFKTILRGWVGFKDHDIQSNFGGNISFFRVRDLQTEKYVSSELKSVVIPH